VNGAFPVKLNFKLVESPIRKESSPVVIKAVGSFGFKGCVGVGEISTLAQLNRNKARNNTSKIRMNLKLKFTLKPKVYSNIVLKFPTANIALKKVMVVFKQKMR
jgi:hypothetical protein